MYFYLCLFYICVSVLVDCLMTPPTGTPDNDVYGRDIAAFLSMVHIIRRPGEPLHRGMTRHTKCHMFDSCCSHFRNFSSVSFLLPNTETRENVVE
ncbi:hypothetical protein BJV74DRAFT_867989 [Russula compacta]|nr:hypothetical protein BJV74DRAFT_867989 [Russula compacta]